MPSLLNHKFGPCDFLIQGHSIEIFICGYSLELITIWFLPSHSSLQYNKRSLLACPVGTFLLCNHSSQSPISLILLSSTTFSVEVVWIIQDFVYRLETHTLLSRCIPWDVRVLFDADAQMYNNHCLFSAEVHKITAYVRSDLLSYASLVHSYITPSVLRATVSSILALAELYTIMYSFFQS